MRNRGTGGFSVLELLIALVLATILLPVLGQALVGIMRVDRQLHGEMQSGSDLQYVVWFLKRDTESINQVLDWGKNNLSFIGSDGFLVRYDLRGRRIRRRSKRGTHYLSQRSKLDHFEVENLNSHLLITLVPREGKSWSVIVRL